MKITSVRCFHVEGPPREGLALYEIPRGGMAPQEVSPYRTTFTEIETDAGLVGLSNGGSLEVVALGQELIGHDPVAVEAIWDRLYSGAYNRLGRLKPLAVLDLALWDLLGKLRGEPVYRLLGGPCQERLRAYAGMLGFSVEPEAAARRSAEWVAKGFTALKWYLAYNQADGQEGLRQNVALVRAVREAVGDDVDIMVDCILSGSQGNSLLYARELARRLAPYHPAWLEEPLHNDDLDAYRMLAQSTSIPLAVGERWQSRWQIKALLDSGAPSVLQPDPNGAGGITEMVKIMTLASAYGLPVVPHANESCRNAVHLLFAQPARTCPLGEWGVKINYNIQWFYQDFYEPVEGYFPLPKGPGFGYALDPGKIVATREITL
jgi:L-rhamnonate dehydratase